MSFVINFTYSMYQLELKTMRKLRRILSNVSQNTKPIQELFIQSQQWKY